MKEQSGATINYSLTLIPVGVALNIVAGILVNLVKLPIYLDAIGTILVTLIIGWRGGALTGIISCFLASLFGNPVLPYFSGTHVAIALYTYFLGLRQAFSKKWSILISGLGLGVIAGIVSAPVIAFLFGGITGSGRSLVTAYLLSMGKNIWEAIIYSGLASEPVDKTIQLVLAIWLLNSTPRSILDRFNSRILKLNGFTN